MSKELKEVLGRLWAKSEHKQLAEAANAKPVMDAVYWLSDRISADDSAYKILRGLRTARDLNPKVFDSYFKTERFAAGSGGVFCQFEGWLDFGIVLTRSSSNKNLLTFKGGQNINLCIAELAKVNGIFKPLRQLPMPLKSNDTSKNTDLAVLKAEVMYQKEWAKVLPVNSNEMERAYESAIIQATDRLSWIVDKV